MKKRILSILLCIVMCLSLMPMVVLAEITAQPEIATWEGWRTAAATFTFDDGMPCHITDVAPAFDAYGYKASFYLVVNWEPDWSGFAALAANGHEIGSHSKTHNSNMWGEEATSKKDIEEKIGYPCLTVAYPNCNVPSPDTAVAEHYICGRVGDGSWLSIENIMGVHGPTDWKKVPSFMTGSEGTIKTTDDFTAKMQDAIDKNGWVTFLTHGLTGKSNAAAYSPTDENAIKGALAWANENDDKIWVTSMVNAAMYVKERDASTLALSAQTSTTATYTLTHSIADAICKYQYPLSVRVPLPAGWKEATVTQDGTSVDCEIKEGMVYFSAVPNSGNIVLTKPVHTHSYTAVVTNPTCTEKGYTTHTCSCGDSYVDTYVTAKGHTYGEWVNTKEATETETGIKERTCSVCGDKDTEVIPVLVHTHKSTLHNGNPATCTAAGVNDYYTCSCGKAFEDATCNIEIADLDTWKAEGGNGYIAPKGHTYGKWSAISETQHQRVCASNATHVETANHTFSGDTCVNCGYTKSGGGIIVPTDYTLTFNVNGGSAIGSVSGTYGKVIDLDKYVPTKSGFDFGGWYTDSALTTPVVEIKLTGNTTVYAKWTEKAIIVPVSPFMDVKTSDWSYDDIAYVREKGLMQGTSETTFAPKVNTSRAMIVTILWRLEGEPVVNYTMSFDDVADGQWYTEAIRWAQANGIVNGYSAEKFGTNNSITREQMAAILYRYADFKGYDVSAKADLFKFTDSGKIGGWATDAIAWANANNLVNGVSTTELDPQGKATREQVAAILHRFCENIVK